MLIASDFSSAISETVEIVRNRAKAGADPWATSPQPQPGAHRRYRAVHVIGWSIAKSLTGAGMSFEEAAEAVRMTEAAETYVSAAQAGLSTDLWLAVIRIAYRDGDGMHDDMRFEVGPADRIARITAGEAEQFGRPYGGGFHMGVSTVVQVNLLTAYARAQLIATRAGFDLSATTIEPKQ